MSIISFFGSAKRKKAKKQNKTAYTFFFDRVHYRVCLSVLRQLSLRSDDLRELSLNQAPVDTALHYSTTAYF